MYGQQAGITPTLPTLVPSAAEPRTVQGYNMNVMPITYPGSGGGVPPPTMPASMQQAGAGSGALAAQYGAAKASQSPGRQGIYWLVVLMVAAVFMFAHMAGVEVRA